MNTPEHIQPSMHQPKPTGSGRSIVTAIGLMLSAAALAAGADSPGTAADETSTPIYREMVSRLEQVKVSTVVGNGVRECTLQTRPVFRYSDQEREIADATLWLWTDENGRPVALEKEEACAFRQRPQWTVCWASLYPELVKVQWSRSSRGFTTTKPGCDFQPIPGDFPEAKTESQLKLQIRQASKRFKCAFDGGRTEGRTFPKAIYEYAAPTQGVLSGAVFGLSAYGTNPDGYLVIEARKTGDQVAWVYGCARMTTSSIDVTLDGQPAWSCPATDTNTNYRENWTFFFEPRPAAPPEM